MSRTGRQQRAKTEDLLEAKFDGRFLCDEMVDLIDVSSRDLNSSRPLSPSLLNALRSIDPTFFLEDISQKLLKLQTHTAGYLQNFYKPWNSEWYDICPLLLAFCMEKLNLQPGQTFGHVGHSSGYALAVAAALLGPTGRCFADAELSNTKTEAMGRLEMAKTVSSVLILFLTEFK